MSIFYVYQGKTYISEKNGGFLWSPKRNEKGHQNKGYTMMTKIKKNDIILHNFNGQIMAISFAQGNCYSASKPYSKTTNWNDDGYKVDTVYKELDTPLKVTDHKSWLVDNYYPDSAFTIKGTGKQQYMCSINEQQAIYLINEAIKVQTNKTTIKLLNDVLADIVRDKSEDYDSLEKDEIDNLIENQTLKPNWRGIKYPQQLMMSTIVERQSPKRNAKVAADALARAEYKCEYNVNDRVFERKSGKGYTEPHHLIPISKYQDFDYKHCSLDVMENIVSLCSHCHNLLHYGKLEDKLLILQKIYGERKEALESVGLYISIDDLITYYS